MIKMKNLFFFSMLLMMLMIGCGDDYSQQKQEELAVEVLDTATYMKNGKEIAQSTFNVLSQHLKQAMTKGGVENAVKFCNVNAMPLTDSLAQYYNVTIKRTSHKVRNPNNEPFDQEQEILDDYLSERDVLKPVLRENGNGSVSYYAPIVMKGLCVTCHGQVGTSISEKDYQIIQSLYPEDKAVGFNEGELRGIWSITFNR